MTTLAARGNFKNDKTRERPRGIISPFLSSSQVHKPMGGRRQSHLSGLRARNCRNAWCRQNFKWDQLTPSWRIDQMLRPIADAPCIRASPPCHRRRGRYLLRRGCAMKSRDTASTCSLFAWWLLMVLEYILWETSSQNVSHSRVIHHYSAFTPKYSDPTNSRRYCFATAWLRRRRGRERKRERDGLMRLQKGEKKRMDKIYWNWERRSREWLFRVSCLRMNRVSWNKSWKTT